MDGQIKRYIEIFLILQGGIKHAERKEERKKKLIKKYI